RASASGSIHVPVTLTIGSGGSVVVAFPSQLFFRATSTLSPYTTLFRSSFNGSATFINSFSFTPTSGGVSFINTVFNGSTATLSVNNTNLRSGNYTGTETLNTSLGPVQVPVTMTITSNNGVTASPSSAQF